MCELWVLATDEHLDSLQKVEARGKIQMIEIEVTPVVTPAVAALSSKSTPRALAIRGPSPVTQLSMDRLGISKSAIVRKGLSKYTTKYAILGSARVRPEEQQL